MNEIDPGIKDLLERARPARPVAGADWRDVLRRSRRGRGRLFGVPTRGVLLAAAVLVGLGAAAQAETGVFQFGTGHHKARARHREPDVLRRFAAYQKAFPNALLLGLPHDSEPVYGILGVSAARMAAVFGGPASTYPPRAGVVVVRGPLSIPLYLQGCVQIPHACPVPVGRWAWLAYTVTPAPKTGELADSPNVRLLRAAPAGTPFPDLTRLGMVLTEHEGGAFAGTIARQHQGAIEIVARHGARLTEAHVACRYRKNGYTLPVCGALARYVAFLRLPHPDETAPDNGDFSRVSGDLGGWRGNLVITPGRLSEAPPGLRAAVERGLASTHGTPIKQVPAGIDCVVNPLPCFRSVATTTHKVIDAINRHGFDLQRIQPEQIPARFAANLPPGAHIDGAATNAGEPSVASHGFMLTIVFDRTVPDSLRTTYKRGLPRTWNVMVDENCLTFYHPFYLPVLPPHDLYKRGPKNRLRRLRQYQVQSRIDVKKDKFGYLVLRTMDALTRTR